MSLLYDPIYKKLKSSNEVLTFTVLEANKAVSFGAS